MKSELQTWTADELRARRSNTNGTFVQPVYEFCSVVLDIQVGTPEQSFHVAVETAQRTFFLLDKSLPPQREKTRFYNPDKSQTAELVNGDYHGVTSIAEVAGVTYSDIALLFVPFRQEFGLVDNFVSGFEDAPFPTDGVFGLGWDARKPDEKPGPAASPIVNFFHAASPTDNVERLVQHYIGESSSIIFFASLTMAECSQEVNYLPILTDISVPTVKINGFSTGKYVNNNGGRAVPDSGYAVVLFPRGVYDSVLKMVKPVYDWELNIFTVPCTDKLAAWNFEFNGETYSTEAYIVDLGLNDGRCAFAVGQSFESTPTYVLGIPFFRGACVVFHIDQNAIGFSQHAKK